MGITTYLFHKSNTLEKQKFNMFFLDMGENIHFHYRDLRIELSVDEFIELAELFSTYAKDVIAEIDGGYKDGILANTNEIGTLKTFWDKEKKLNHPVKYHERQLAVEETKDGYHLHIRNYKILLYKESFKNLVKAIAPILPLLEGGELERDPLKLLVQNELHARLVSRIQTEDAEEILVEVPETFCKKAGQVLKAIGFGEQDPAEKNGYIYSKDTTTITLIPPGSAPSATTPSGTGRHVPLCLPVFLAEHGGTIDADQLNQLKVKILSLLKMAEKGVLAPFRLEHIYIHPTLLNPAVDLFSKSVGIHMPDEISRFSKMLAGHKLFFIKPKKAYLPAERQADIHDAFFRFVMERLACHDCVRKIYVLGSSTNHKLGKYSVPFVHFDWVKINSDFDIYIELDPESDAPIPPEWQKQFYWDRVGSDYYHFGELGDGMSSEAALEYPHVRFYDHLIEGYLFDPRKGDTKKRDKWFQEIKAQCIFSRDRVGRWIGEHYSIAPLETERFKVASFNTVYHVKAEPHDFVLKVYDSKHLTPQNRRKIGYEIEVLDSLKNSGLDIALPVKNRLDEYITPKDTTSNGKAQAVVFTFAPGKYIARPNSRQIALAGSLLARFHNEAKRFRTKQSKNYGNKEPLFYWLKAWREYNGKNITGTDITLNIAGYERSLKELKTFPTHCHGDLSLINFLFEEDRCRLIDFQSIAYGPALIDLANGMVEFSAGKREFTADNLTSFRAGYETIRPLSGVEKGCLTDLLIIQTAVRQAKLIRLHYGGFGYELKEDRLIGLKMGLEHLLRHKN
jgi:Ser/Thr protein kinase RdoA (MazF antagonist)